MTFMNSLENQLKSQKQLTENGAVGYRTSGKELLDMNFAAGSMRSWSDFEIVKRFMKVYYEDTVLAVRWLFYLRDIRGLGMGERHLFRVCLKWLVENHYDYVVRVIDLIPEYGRYDDWRCLLDTKAKDIVISRIREQLARDICSMEEGKEISLLAKWFPSCNTSSSAAKRAARIICNELGLCERDYRQTLARLRAYLNVVEVQMTADRWEEIDYSKLPSRANLIYGNAFLRRDERRRRDFLEKLSRGETTIHADVLFPSDIVAQYYEKRHGYFIHELKGKDDTLEELWKALPDYVCDDSSTLVVRDGSGSMCRYVGSTRVTALEVATALTIYFAGRCKGQYFDKFITFSSSPQMIDLSKAGNLRDKLEVCEAYADCTNTDIKAVFSLVLRTAVENDLTQDELPDNILIVSDMEFDCILPTYKDRNGVRDICTLFEQIENEYQVYGYRMPRLVFWNVSSRTCTIPLQENEAGVALVSGFNPAVYRMVLSDELDPYKCLLEQICSKRYDAVEEALKR